MKGLVIVTGGTKGIGRAVINRFASEGYPVAACARNAADLEALKQEVAALPGAAAVHVKPCDMSKKEEVAAFAEWLLGLELPIDLLCNNAGVFIPGKISEEEEGALELMVNTNLYSAYHLTRALLPAMMGRRQGHIFNICSTASIMPYINGGSYCISKYALLGMTKVLREEMKEHGLRVTAVMPGATLTASWEGVDLPEERFMKSEDVAEAIWAAWTLSGRTVVEELLLRPQLGDI